MLKKIFWLTLIISALFVCAGINASAATTYTTADGNVYEISNNEAKFVKCGITNVYVYSENTPYPVSEVFVDGKSYPITTIGEDCFDYSTSIKHVSLNGNVRTIEKNAFQYLQYIKLCNTVKDIQGEAFGTSIQKIDVVSSNPYFSSVNGVLYNKNKTTLVKYAGAYSNTNTEFTVPATVTAIAPYAFSERKHFNKITLSENCITIGEGAFMACTALKDINLPNSIKRIDYKAFWQVPFNNLVLPEGLEYIGALAFAKSGNENTDLVIPDSVTVIDDSAFEYSLYKSVKLPKNLAELGESAFYSCNFTEITIPGCLWTINKYTFRYNSKLEKVVFEQGVKKIDKYSFANCPSLKEIVLPVSITEIKSDVFYKSSSITDVYYNGTASEWADVNNAASGWLFGVKFHLKINAVFESKFGTTTVPAYTESDITALPAPGNRLGYEFAGWQDKDGNIYQPGEAITGISEDCVFNACFNPTIYTETVYSEGGYQIKPTGVPEGTSIIVVAYDGDTIKHFGECVYAGENSLTVFGPSAEHYAVYVWAGLGNLKPICEPEIH